MRTREVLDWATKYPDAEELAVRHGGPLQLEVFRERLAALEAKGG